MSSDSSSQSAIIFDGTDLSISFNTFLIQFLKQSHRGREPTDVLPAHLYGEALRFFESLDILCQNNSSRLVSVMTRRFPGTPGTQNPYDHQLSASDDQTMPTLAASPPDTFALYKSPSFSTPELSSLALKGNGSNFNLVARKRSSIFSSWKDKLHVNIRPFRSKTPPPPRVFAPLEITVHSFFIEKFPFRHHTGPGILIVQIDLNDRQAVEKVKNQQLLSVHRNDTTDFRAGFSYSIRAGTAYLILENKISGSKNSGNVKPRGPREISPLGPIIRRDSIEVFHQDRAVTTGKYQVTSMIEEGLLETRGVNDKLGAIQWWIEVTDSRS